MKEKVQKKPSYALLGFSFTKKGFMLQQLETNMLGPLNVVVTLQTITNMQVIM